MVLLLLLKNNVMKERKDIEKYGVTNIYFINHPHRVNYDKLKNISL